MTLRVLLDEHPEELRADLRAVYGLDLLDLWRGDLGVLALTDYVQALPPGSAVWRAMGGDQAWTTDQHMLSMIEHNTRIVWWAKTKDGREGRRPPERLTPPKSPREEAMKAARAAKQLHRKNARAATRARLRKTHN